MTETETINPTMQREAVIDEIHRAAERLRGIVNVTPIMTSRTLNHLTGFEVYLKCENFQRMGAFKFRGAYNALSSLSPEQKRKGVVTHSSGNHAQAVALAGQLLGIKTTIVMPNNAPKVKVEATRQYGGTIVMCKPTQRAREETCNQLIQDHGYTLIHPYDNINVIQGAATAVKELFEQVGNLDAVIAPVGGGGLISGTAIYAKETGKSTHVFAAEPQNADDAYRSLRKGSIVPQDAPNTIADGLRTGLSELTFRFIQQYVDDIMLVSEQEILETMEFLWTRMKIVVEPSGAVSVAAIRKLQIQKGSKVGIIVSGGNVDLQNYFSSLSRQVHK